MLDMNMNTNTDEDLRDEKEYLKTNLEICFNLISQNKDIFKNKDTFLEEFSPWHQEGKGKELIKDFEKQVANDTSEDFSWLNILKEDNQWKEAEYKEEIKDKSKYLNMRYQIPTHFHGDIDKAILFHCMENPRGYLGSYTDNQIDKGLECANFKDYYEKTYKLLKEDNKKTIKEIRNYLEGESENKPVKEIIKERYGLEEIDSDAKLSTCITQIIYSENSNLAQELTHMFNPEEISFDKKYNNKELKELGYYYLPEYYKEIVQERPEKGPFIIDISELQNNNAEEIAKKICNLEIYPFSCSQPALGEDGIGEKILLNSNLSRLGAYIVLRRIYQYVADNNETQIPIFVFRKYDRAWKKLFNKIFLEAEEKSENFKADDFLSKLEENFFYCQPAIVGGGITSGNVISVHDFRRVDRKKDKENYEGMKKKAFCKVKKTLYKSIEAEK